jgi:hypothetical protein
MPVWHYFSACLLALRKNQLFMSTQEIAEKLVALCREGKNIDAINELYSDDIVSHESMGDHLEVTGKEAVIGKNQGWFSSVDEIHDSSVSDPIVAGNFFSVAMMYDVTYKESGRMIMDEIALYVVKDGRIVMEHFYYGM